MNESAFWMTHIEDAIGARIAPRFRICFSSLNEKPSSKLDQISAMQITVAVVVPIVCPMIAPLTPAPADEDGDDGDQVEGRASGFDQRVGERAALEPDDHLAELEDRPDAAR